MTNNAFMAAFIKFKLTVLNKIPTCVQSCIETSESFTIIKFKIDCVYWCALLDNLSVYINEMKYY